MKRRNLLTLTSLALGARLSQFAFPSLQQAIASDNFSEWGYTGKTAPENWGNLSAEYKICQVGSQQSPIDLNRAIDSKLSKLKIEYKDVPLKILNNGNTIRVNTTPGNYLILDETSFELLQFHFHHPSEHTVEGNVYPMEIHLVHQNERGELAVLGIFCKTGKENLTLKPIWDAMPSKKKAETKIAGVKITISDLLPKSKETYRYFGSLTTPPCLEVVNWIVFKEPMEVSQEQIDRFKKIFPLNARPVQSFNRRVLFN